MITKTMTSRYDLSNFFGVARLPRSSIRNKRELIQIANKGGDRPSRKTKLGRVLSNYTCKLSGSYCPKFDKTIRELAPHWFLSRMKIANQKRQKLIKMAKNGKDKPHWKSKLFQYFKSYITKSSGSYCPKFYRTIKKFAPSWLLSRKQVSNQKKQELIRMANSGENRPKQKTKIGCALSSYTKKSSLAYDPVFDKLIRKLRPDWFE